MKKLAAALALAAGVWAAPPAHAQQPGCTTLSLTIGCYVYPQAILQVPQILPNGSNVAPSLAWLNAPSTGIYWNPVTGGLDWTFAGVAGGEMASTGLQNTPIGSITPQPGAFTRLSGSTRLIEPQWTTATRPTSPTVGEQGWNTNLTSVEWWNGTAWIQPGATSTFKASAVLSWSTNITVAAGTYTAVLSWPWTNGTVNSISYATGGVSSPQFTGQVTINGTNVSGCGVTVSSSTVNTYTCPTPGSLVAGNTLAVVISAVTGTPNSASFQVNYTHSEP